MMYDFANKKSLKKEMAIALTIQGVSYAVRSKYLNALNYFQQSLKIKEEISDKLGIAATLINIGRISIKQGDHAQAIIWCEKGLHTAEEINIVDEQKHGCQCLYDAYKALGNDKQAIKWYEPQGKPWTLISGQSPEEFNLSFSSAEAEREGGLKYHEKMLVLDDSLQTEETSKKLQQMEFAKQMLADSLIQVEEKLKVQLTHEAEVRKKNRTRNIYIMLALFLLIGAGVLYSRIRYIKRAKTAIEKERDRSNKLLLNILPMEIAEELKEKGRSDARNFEMVTILFTDFKEFTQTSEKLSAEELVGEINTCFEAFDAICGKYGIEKIKTIGDSYMVAGGIPVPTDDSVMKTVLAGIEMANFMINRKQEREAEGNIPFEMRVGIHTGPVVAGIVGVKKFQYDIWRDTVNTASHMENSGEVGKVNISLSTYELIKGDPTFKFQFRGTVKAKGKGVIEMWFVEKVS